MKNRMKNRTLAVMFVVACLPVTATGSLIVTAHGYTIGTQGEKTAAVSLAGGDPSVIAVQSIQSGASPLYPNFPVHIEASLLGSGAATYGALAASLEAQVKNLAAIPNILEPEASGILRMSFADQGVVVSSTLAVGEEVDLDFYFALSSDFMDTGRLADPTHNGASVEFNGTAKDITSGAFVKAVIVNGSAGTDPLGVPPNAAHGGRSSYRPDRKPRLGCDCARPERVRWQCYRYVRGPRQPHRSHDVFAAGERAADQ